MLHGKILGTLYFYSYITVIMLIIDKNYIFIILLKNIAENDYKL